MPNNAEQTCSYDAISQQLSNTEYIYNQDAEQYSVDHLRICHFMATYEDSVTRKN